MTVPSCHGAVLVSEVGVNRRVVEDLTDGLLDHFHDEVVKLKLSNGFVAIAICCEAVPSLVGKRSEVAAEEGRNVVPSFISVASEEIHKETARVGSDLTHSLNNADEASEGVTLDHGSIEGRQRSGGSHGGSEHGDDEENDEFLSHFQLLDCIIIIQNLQFLFN